MPGGLNALAHGISFIAQLGSDEPEEQTDRHQGQDARERQCDAGSQMQQTREPVRHSSQYDCEKDARKGEQQNLAGEPDREQQHNKAHNGSRCFYVLLNAQNAPLMIRRSCVVRRV